MTAFRDEFLSEEDLDLRNLSREELLAYWDQWLLQAQVTNADDRRSYSHGVFMLIEEPEAAAGQQRVAEAGQRYGVPASGSNIRHATPSVQGKQEPTGGNRHP